jgi:hypothetical protein
MNGGLSMILCGDLVKAVRRESNLAICHWWGVTPQTVSKRRKALNVPQVNEGTARLYRDYAPERLPPEVQEWAREAARSPDARAKLAAARRGKPMHPKVVAAFKAQRHRKPSPPSGQKMSETHRRRRSRPGGIGAAWKEAEDALLGTMPDEEVAARTGRTLCAVRVRRAKLDIDFFYRKRQRRSRRGQGYS